MHTYRSFLLLLCGLSGCGLSVEDVKAWFSGEEDAPQVDVSHLTLLDETFWQLASLGQIKDRIAKTQHISRREAEKEAEKERIDTLTKALEPSTKQNKFFKANQKTRAFIQRAIPFIRDLAKEDPDENSQASTLLKDLPEVLESINLISDGCDILQGISVKKRRKKQKPLTKDIQPKASKKHSYNENKDNKKEQPLYENAEQEEKACKAFRKFYKREMREHKRPYSPYDFCMEYIGWVGFKHADDKIATPCNFVIQRLQSATGITPVQKQQLIDHYVKFCAQIKPNPFNTS